MKKFLLLCFLLVTLSSCAAINPIETSSNIDDSISPKKVEHRLEIVESKRTKPAGFWEGLWHGTVSPFAFVYIIFGGDVGVYETYNTGNWYNFGFLIGTGAILAGGSSSSSKS